MYVVPLSCLFAIVHAVPSHSSILQQKVNLNPWAHDEPSVQPQSSLKLKASTKSSHKCIDSSSCGPSTVCPAYEGEDKNINGRDYRLYCINAPFGSYTGLPTAKSLDDCEAKCHASAYDCNALTFYPSTGE